jgi:hypothetical protein
MCDSCCIIHTWVKPVIVVSNAIFQCNRALPVQYQAEDQPGHLPSSFSLPVAYITVGFLARCRPTIALRLQYKSAWWHSAFASGFWAWDQYTNQDRLHTCTRPNWKILGSWEFWDVRRHSTAGCSGWKPTNPSALQCLAQTSERFLEHKCKGSCVF